MQSAGMQGADGCFWKEGGLFSQAASWRRQLWLDSLSRSNVVRSNTSPSTGFSSIFQSPVCTMVPCSLQQTEHSQAQKCDDSTMNGDCQPCVTHLAALLRRQTTAKVCCIYTGVLVLVAVSTQHRHVPVSTTSSSPPHLRMMSPQQSGMLCVTLRGVTVKGPIS